MAKYLELMSDDTRDKVKKLPPWAKGVFSEFLVELYARESKKVLGFLHDSRSELRSELQHIHREQEELRGETLPPLDPTDPNYVDPRAASLARRGISHEKLQRYLQRKLAEQAPRTSTSSRTTSSLSFASTSTSLELGNSRPSTRSSDHFKTRQNGSQASKAASEGQKSGRASSNSKSGSERSRSQPEERRMSREVTLPGTPDPLTTKEKTMKESEALIAAAGEVESKEQNERVRQIEKVRHAKEKKKKRRQQQADLAAQMVELATEVAAAQNKDKERQEQKVKNRLEEMKKKREDSTLSNR